MRNLFLPLVCALSLLSAVARAQGPIEAMLPDALIYPGDRPGNILVVDKTSQLLYLYRHDGGDRIELDRIMRCSTGENLGDKLVEGDKKTPNGFYIFNQKLLPRELSPIYGALAYPTDYPNFWDKNLGRGGYGIWLHGINKPMTDYDSNGCIELENADIAAMEDLLALYDTPLITYESLVQAPADELRREGRDVRDFLESWREAWVSKNHAAYRDKYAPEFVNSDGRSFAAWMSHKEAVAKNYQTIKVDLKELRVYRHRDVLTASFVQDYLGGGRFSSVGLKRLYLKKTGDGYKIIGEEFQPLPRFDANKKLSPEEKLLALSAPPLSAAQAKAEPEGSRAAAEARASAGSRDLAGGESSEEGPEDISSTTPEAPAPPAPAPPAEAATTAEAPTPPAETPSAETVTPAKAPTPPAETATADAPPAAPRARPAPPEAREMFADLVERWALAWSNKEAETYFGFYHPDFYYQDKDMNLAGFRAYREELMDQAELLEVSVSQVEVQLRGESAWVRFQQDYRSDRWRDRGRKILIFKKTGSEWKIISEAWRGK